MEEKVSDKAFIEVEINSLEDAYLNIAKQEEKLLEAMSHDVSPEVVGPVDIEMQISPSKHVPNQAPMHNEEVATLHEIERYTNAVASPRFYRQLIANFYRRLRAYKNQPKEIMLSMTPFNLPVLMLCLILVVVQGIEKITAQNSETGESAVKTDDVINFLLPVFSLMGILVTCGLYVVTPTEDRELKLRYFLNFSGMQSTAYFLGFMFADFLIFTLP